MSDTRKNLLEQLEYLNTLRNNAQENVKRAQEAQQNAVYIAGVVSALDLLIDSAIVELYAQMKNGQAIA